MIAMSVRDQNGMHDAESRVRRAGNGVAGIVKNAYARRVFEQDRPVPENVPLVIPLLAGYIVGNSIDNVIVIWTVERVLFVVLLQFVPSGPVLL